MAEEEAGGGGAAVQGPGGAEGVVPSQDVRKVKTLITQRANINSELKQAWSRSSH